MNKKNRDKRVFTDGTNDAALLKNPRFKNIQAKFEKSRPVLMFLF